MAPALPDQELGAFQEPTCTVLVLVRVHNPAGAVPPGGPGWGVWGAGLLWRGSKEKLLKREAILSMLRLVAGSKIIWRASLKGPKRPPNSGLLQGLLKCESAMRPPNFRAQACSRAWAWRCESYAGVEPGQVPVVATSGHLDPAPKTPAWESWRVSRPRRARSPSKPAKVAITPRYWSCRRQAWASSGLKEAGWGDWARPGPAAQQIKPRVKPKLNNTKRFILRPL